MLFVLLFFQHQMFLCNVICVQHCNQIPILEEPWKAFAYEKSKAEGSGICCISISVQKKDNHVWCWWILAQ